MKKTNHLTQCPDDEELMQYKLRQTPDEAFELITEHLVVCDPCVQMLLDVLPESELEWKAWKEESREDPAEPLIFGKDIIDSRFAEEFEKIRQEVLTIDAKFVRIDDVPVVNRFKTGQIWRPRSTNIAVPTESGIEYVNSEDLGAYNHFVVVASDGSKHVGQFEVVEAVVLDDEAEVREKGEIVIPAGANPLGISLVFQKWNPVEILVQNLEGFYGQIDESWIRQEIHRSDSETSLTLFEAARLQSETECYDASYLVSAGMMANPIYRYRAKQYSETVHLRYPIERLRDQLSQDAVPASSESSISFTEGISTSLKEALSRTGLASLADQLRIRAVSHIPTTQPALAADGSIRCLASLASYRGGWIVLEIRDKGRARLRGQFDFPSLLRVAVINLATGEWIPIADDNNEPTLTMIVRSGRTVQDLNLALPRDLDLLSKLRLIVFEVKNEGGGLS